ncbi:hypothetical protein OAD67_02490, partial [bacterium]|nr:hypothetical protein [bacterium]
TGDGGDGGNGRVGGVGASGSRGGDTGRAVGSGTGLSGGSGPGGSSGIHGASGTPGTGGASGTPGTPGPGGSVQFRDNCFAEDLNAFSPSTRLAARVGPSLAVPDAPTPKPRTRNTSKARGAILVFGDITPVRSPMTFREVQH